MPNAARGASEYWDCWCLESGGRQSALRTGGLKYYSNYIRSGLDVFHYGRVGCFGEKDEEMTPLRVF